MPEQETIHTVILISATTEWRVVRAYYPDAELQLSPYGDWFVIPLEVNGQEEPVIFFTAGGAKSPQRPRPSTSSIAGRPPCSSIWARVVALRERSPGARSCSSSAQLSTISSR